MLNKRPCMGQSVGTVGAVGQLAALALLAALGSDGCATSSGPGSGRSESDRFTRLEQHARQLENRLTVLEQSYREALSAALCSAADREFFANVRAELSSQNKPQDCSTAVALSCSAQQISPAIRGRGGLGALYKGQHSRAAFYLPKDATTLPGYRLDRLNRLGYLPLLPTTFFVFFASPATQDPNGQADARRRIEMANKTLIEHLSIGIKDRLRNSGMSDETQLEKRTAELIKDRIWNLRLDSPLRRKDLDPVDLPLTRIGEPDDLRQGVWVVRVDC